MMRFPILTQALLSGWLSLLSLTAAASEDLPNEPISQLYQDAKTQPGDKEQRLAKNRQLLEKSRQCLADHPEVPVTAPMREILVRRVMLPAAERLYRDQPSQEHRRQLRELAADVANNPLMEGHLIVSEKVRAAYLMARLDTFHESDTTPVDAPKHIRALVAQFPVMPDAKEPTAFAGQALVYAAQLAVESKETTLANEYCQVIAERYLAADNAIEVLIAAGHPPLFTAEMQTLDGKLLRFPEDTRGKVVLIDFWATWCGPCVASLPHIKQLVEKYKDKDVLIVGVSCDEPRQLQTLEDNKAAVSSFVKNKGFDGWTHCWSGKWPQAAVTYGVNRIPTVFLLGRAGHINSTTARGREETLIDQALSISNK